MPTKFLATILAIACCLPMITAQAGERALAKEDAKRKQITHSMIGFRNTLLFYVFADAKAVLRLSIDNKSDAFPVTGTVYLFAESENAETIGKWLNNQHSDGLFVDPPKPIATHQLPAKACRVTTKTFVAEHENHFNKKTFREHKLEIAVDAIKNDGVYALKAFTDTAKVYLAPGN